MVGGVTSWATPWKSLKPGLTCHELTSTDIRSMLLVCGADKIDASRWRRNPGPGSCRGVSVLKGSPSNGAEF